MSGSGGFEPWRLMWRAEHIERFWNWYGTHPRMEATYFSKQVGDAILDEISRHVPMRGVFLDVGAGPGYLVQKLVERGLDTLAVDPSASSVRSLRERLGRHRHFLGAHVSVMDRLPLADATADTALLLETVEHLDDGVCRSILRDLRRVTKPGGHIVVTTPNEEDLSAAETMCPNCGCVFHMIQHMRSFTAASLAEMMGSAGFVELVCKPVLFSRYPRVLRPLHRVQYVLQRAALPHLVYIGRSP